MAVTEYDDRELVGSSAEPSLSVVIPCLNEEDNVRPLLDRLMPVLEKLPSRFEVIFVDDGSRDETVNCVLAAREQDDRVKLIQLSRNFGHQIALSAGMEHACGDAVISMDADLQHPPELIPTLVDKWRDGYEVVATVRDETEDASWAKKTTSRLFYKFLNAITGLELPEGAADFRLLGRRAVDALCACEDQSRFLRGLVQWIGFRQAFVHYDAAPRFAGVTKYTWRRMFRFAVDAALSFSVVPLRAAVFLGLGTVSLGLIYGVYVLWARLFADEAVAGWASLMIALLVIGGVQLVVLGILGEYLGRTFQSARHRPLYIMARSAGLGRDACVVPQDWQDPRVSAYVAK